MSDKTHSSMKIRAITYWIICVLLAFAAAHATGSSGDAQIVAVTGAETLSTVAVPDSVRSLLLMAGILAVAHTYRRAWLNFRGQPAS
jgi:hypothetical protein